MHAKLSNNYPEGDMKRVAKSEDDLAVLTVRILIADLCNQHGSGHGGSAIGMAAIGVALWKYAMRYNPNDPAWFDRDRFVLSNGHASTFLYAMNHLVGYDAWTMSELKGYGSAKMNGHHTLCHAHPEIQTPAVEVTTGPLGQGIANAVGLAIASKNLAANFNKDDTNIINSRIWCTTGDGCLMEGVAMEAISLAGSLGLDNLTLIYDNNAVTCDGPLDWINTEDTNAKMRAQGWQVIDVMDGNVNVQDILAVLRLSTTYKGKPVFINVRTTIGVDTAVAGTYKAHHGAIDKDSLSRWKSKIGLSPESSHTILPESLAFFRERKDHGARLQSEWEAQLERYCHQYPEDGKSLKSRLSSSTDHGVKLLSELDSKQFQGNATRQSNGAILELLWQAVPSICGGGADLVNSNQIKYADIDVFHPTVGYKGRYLRNGIREHAMTAIANGLAAYHPRAFLPITATYLLFYLYAAPGVRMGALSELPAIHIATHDSFLEVDSLFRAMPGLRYFRPCDAEELIGCWMYALQSTKNPCMLSLARDPVKTVSGTDRSKVEFGAYVIRKQDDHAVTLASCGSNLYYAVEAADELTKRGIPARVHKREVFPLDGKPIVSVEEYVATTWARYATASIGMTTFGYSASNESNYDRFGLDAKGIVAKVEEYLGELGGADAQKDGWRQLRLLLLGCERRMGDA
ncbi:hypothetical protein FDECE_4885 [Fusarium decemcellulare]|nr:hypothetical protein FDECE_4885 [Fusarium decemcellulare]